MEIKTFEHKLNDGKVYTFSERPMNAVDYAANQKRVRAAKMKFIHENCEPETIPWHEKNLLEIESFSGVEVGTWLGTVEEMKKSLFDSFAPQNPGITKEKFLTLVDDKEVYALMDKLRTIEFIQQLSDAELAEELEVDDETIEYWKANHSALYKFIQTSVTKSVKKKKMKKK